MDINSLVKNLMIERVRQKVARITNDRRHATAMEEGLAISISSKEPLDESDSNRIIIEGQNAVDDINTRIRAERGEDPEIRLSYINPNHDLQDRAWIGI